MARTIESAAGATPTGTATDSIPGRKRAVVTTVYFVRHAHSPWVPNREAERALSERGRKQAVRVACLLADRRIDAVLSSPYARAIQTVRPLAAERDLAVQLVDGFRERTLTDGPAEGIGETFESAIEAVWRDPTFAWPGGESNRDARKRGVVALEHVLDRYRGKRVAVGTHGNLLTLLLGHYDDRFDYDFWNGELTTPDVYEAEFADGGLVSVRRRYAPAGPGESGGSTV